MSRCWRSISVSWLPIFMTGLSDVIGSWKTIASCAPQRPRSSSSVAVTRSWPSNMAEPDRSTFFFGSRPMMLRDSTVLPEPDSPTTPSVRPRSSEKLTPSTARASPRGVLNAVLRSTTSRSGPSSGAGSKRSSPMLLRRRRALTGSSGSQRTLPDVELRPEHVAEEVERHHGDEDDERWGEHDVRCVGEVADAGLDRVAPRDLLGVHAGTDDREPGLGDDDDGHAEQCDREHRGQHVREDLAEHHPAVLGALGARGHDELALGPREGRRARDP